MNETKEKNRIGAVNIVFLITILLSLAVGFLPLDFLNGKPALQLIFSQLILIIPAAIYMLKEKMPYKETVGLRKMKAGDILLTILFGFLMRPALNFINGLSMVFAKNTMNTFLLDMVETTPFLITVFMVAVVPCVLEESVYRGFFYTEYQKVNPWKAALLSGLLFGLMHGNLNQFSYAFVMGVVFALLIEATGSILSTMIIHFFVNASSVVSIYVLPWVYKYMQLAYRVAMENGMTEEAQMLSASFGDLTQEADVWLRQMMNTSVEGLTLGAVFATYFMPAVLCSVLAFYVYRVLAKRSGNWERICSFMGRGKTEEPVETITENGSNAKQSMMTIPMMVAIALGVLMMLLYEMVMYLPQ